MLSLLKEVLANRVTGRNSFVDYVIRDPIEPAIGSVMLCDLSFFPGAHQLGLGAEHTGIYIGNGRIVHRSGDGYIEKVNHNEFLERLDGLNCALNVYVSCQGDKAWGDQKAAARAIEALKDDKHSEHYGYDLIFKNCHNFSHYCLTGDKEQSLMDFAFSSLQDLLFERGMDNWRIWTVCHEES